MSRRRRGRSATRRQSRQLQAALHAAETNLSSTDIVAPVDGTVVSRNVEIGQTAAAGLEAPPLFLIASDLAVIQIEAEVS